MKNTDLFIQFSSHFKSVATQISNGLKKNGINVVEVISKLAQPKNATAIEKIIDVMAEVAKDTNSLIISFFQNKGPVKLLFGNNFTNLILSQLPKEFPKPPQSTKNILPRNMNDNEIISAYKIQPYSVFELFAVLYDKIIKQKNGESGELSITTYNLFYVQLNNGRVVVVHVYWYSVYRLWGLYAVGLDAYWWNAVFYVFSRS